jgi:hypothetical protein
VDGEKKELAASDYPEGWQKCLEMLQHLPEEEREAYLSGFMQTILYM